MSIRDLKWIKRRTTVSDLLDDGIENNSDLQQLDSGDELAQPPNPALLRKRSETLALINAEHAATELAAYRKNFSIFGAALGAVIAIASAYVVISPVDMRVEHRRIRYLPTVWEHVTPARSRFYGSVGLVFGVFVVGYSLYRPRSQ